MTSKKRTVKIPFIFQNLERVYNVNFMTLSQYIDIINKRYKLGNGTEHTFRGDLQQLIESIVPNIRATNEPKRQSCGAPDYMLAKKDIPVGFIVAKDVGDDDRDGVRKTNKNQFDRYKASLNTDYGIEPIFLPSRHKINFNKSKLL